MKTRSAGALGAPRLGDQGRRRQEANKRGGGSGKIAVGQFDRFYPGETPIWINISPFALYQQEIYDRKEKAVVQTETTWYETQKHYIPRNKNRTHNGKRVDADFICSAGPYRKHPCWGCAIRSNHYAKLDKIEQEKGVRPDTKAPISSMPQFSLGITVMEKIFAIPLRDSGGMVKKSKATGQILYRYVPAPFAEARADDIAELAQFKYQFGHRMHWTMGPEELGVLIESDDKMKNHCANCANLLFATHVICPGCETVHPIGKTVSGVDLTMERNKNRSCGACGEKGAFVPKVECAECGNGVEGRLTSFDIRITRKKTGTKYLTEIVAIRVPGVPGNAEDHKRAMELIENPLNLAEIFVPKSLDTQKFLCGEELTKGLRPDLAVKKDDDAPDEGGDTESYADEGGGDEDDDGDGNKSIKF